MRHLQRKGPARARGKEGWLTRIPKAGALHRSLAGSYDREFSTHFFALGASPFSLASHAMLLFGRLYAPKPSRRWRAKGGMKRDERGKKGASERKKRGWAAERVELQLNRFEPRYPLAIWCGVWNRFFSQLVRADFLRLFLFWNLHQHHQFNLLQTGRLELLGDKGWHRLHRGCLGR